MPHFDDDLCLIGELMTADLFHQKLDLKLRDRPPISGELVNEVDDLISLFSRVGPRIPHWSYGL